MEFKPDVVHAHDWLTYEAGILAKKNFGIPLIAHVYDELADLPQECQSEEDFHLSHPLWNA